MKILPFFRAILFLVILLVWYDISLHSYSNEIIILSLITGPVCFILFSLLGNYLLNKSPQHVNLINFLVHYSVLFFLGSSVVIAVKQTSFWIKDIDFPEELSLFFILVTGIFCLFTVLNLAISGLGAPFAILLTERISRSFLYKYSRNPMVLSTVLLFASIGLYYQSIYFILWVLILIFPAFIVFLLYFEEKELTIRFGKNYIAYKQQTPFFFPLPGKKMK